MNAHNTYRRLAGVGDLTWDNTLALIAQSWSKQCVWRHSDLGYGENLAASLWRNTADQVEAVHAWYNEICLYDRANPTANTDATGHYTQVVWKASSLLGCGYTACNAGVMGLTPGRPSGVLVCMYSVGGNANSVTSHANNVLMPSSFPNQCPAGFQG